MAHWMCTNCGYHLRDASPPKECPSCKLACAFNDVTCYRPECGGEQNIDPMLVGFTLRLVSAQPARPAPKTTQFPVEAVRLGELFEGLREDQEKVIRGLGHIETYLPDAIICSEGAEAKSIYLVEEGEVTVDSGPRAGLRLPITIVSPGEAFAWSALVPPFRLTATVRATKNTRVLAISRKDLLQAMQADSSMAIGLMQNVARIAASRLRNLQQELAAAVSR